MIIDRCQRVVLRSAIATGLTATLLGCSRSEPAGNDAVQAVFGRTGMGQSEFSYPRAAAIGPAGRLCIVDKAARIQCFDLDANYLFEWRMPEKDVGKPTGLGIGSDGRVYVADTHYARVMVFDEDGHETGRFGSLGDGPGQFVMPTDVAIDSVGNVYVGEYGGDDRISKFAPDWQYLFSFGGHDSGAAHLQRPQSLLIGPDDTLWVTDACGHRICHFGADGALLSTFGHNGSGPGELCFPYGIDWLSDGTLVVCEYGNNRLQRFDTAGNSLGTWGRAGRGKGELAYPWAIAVAPDDRIFVVDSGNNRVQVIAGDDRHTWPTP